MYRGRTLLFKHPFHGLNSFCCSATYGSATLHHRLWFLSPRKRGFPVCSSAAMRVLYVINIICSKRRATFKAHCENKMKITALTSQGLVKAYYERLYSHHQRFYIPRFPILVAPASCSPPFIKMVFILRIYFCLCFMSS